MYLEKLKNQKIVYLIYNNNEITLKRVINKSNKYNDVQKGILQKDHDIMIFGKDIVLIYLRILKKK